MRDRKKRQLNNKGAAMVLTIVIIAIVMIFCFSLILISYNLYASQNKNLASLRNGETSNTLSRAIGAEITDSDNISSSYLWKYVRTNVAYVVPDTDTDWADWPYYDAADATGLHDEKAAFREFTLGKNPDMQGVPADVKVIMYWTLPSDVTTFKDKINNGGNRSGIRLHIKVVSTTASQVYESEECYKLTVRKNDIQGEAILNSIDSSINPANHSIDKTEKWIWKKVK